MDEIKMISWKRPLLLDIVDFELEDPSLSENLLLATTMREQTYFYIGWYPIMNQISFK